MGSALFYSRAIHDVYTLKYRFVGHDLGRCAMINAVHDDDAVRQARRYYTTHGVLAHAVLFDPEGEPVAELDDLRRCRPT